MTPNSYLGNMLSGPVVQAIATGIQNAFQEPNALITYWTTLDILTAQDVDGTLNYVGTLVGYPRPLTTDIFLSAQMFLMTDAALSPGSTIAGFSDASAWTASAFVGAGGYLDTALPSPGNYMPAAWYQQLLPIFAQAEYYGVTTYTVDLLAAWANTQGGGTGYTINRDQYRNIYVVFTTFIDTRALYVVNSIVQYLETLPLVVFEEP